MLIGVSLKVYLDVPATLRWCDAVREVVAARPEMANGKPGPRSFALRPTQAAERVQLWLAPSLPALPLVAARTKGTGIALGAQDLSPFDRGSYTGAISGADLAYLGCRYAVVGHAERYRHFGEDRTTAAAKVAAAVRNGLTPVICVGEPERLQAFDAAERCVSELAAITYDKEVVVAYEPHWAIGAAEPAPDDHIVTVCAALRERVGPHGTVVYGGSAGPGLLTRLGSAVDGLFLGRFAHDPANLAAVLDEATALVHA